MRSVIDGFLFAVVLEHLPPQQGLRLSKPRRLREISLVLEHLPPQQGLRLLPITLRVQSIKPY